MVFLVDRYTGHPRSQAVVEAGAGEVADRIVEVVHAHRDAGGGEVEHFMLDLLAILADPLDGQLALARAP